MSTWVWFLVGLTVGMNITHWVWTLWIMKPMRDFLRHVARGGAP